MVTHNLPAQLTSFIGRTQELAEIAALLADPACRLLTLVGPGGIGKTRLALEIARFSDLDKGMARDAPTNGLRLPSPLVAQTEGLGVRGFPNGIHFIPLQPITDPALLPIAIANAIGIQIFGAEEPRIQLLNYLRERQLLLIFDNFEHLVDGVDFVVELLSALGVKLLITSRAALNIQAEWRYAVTGLDVPNDAHEIEIFDAIKLFSERARRLRHDFSLDEQRTHVIRICQLTEGMPLALELAAGWLKVLSCAEIAHEIQRGLDFLAADARDIPERHRSMAAAFEQSWRLLTDEEQAVFRKMSAFRGGFTREAAKDVTGASLQTLASLVDKSLLRVSATGRYDIHELLRQYAEAKLIAGEIELICDAHSAYYLNFLAQRAHTIHSPKMIEVLDEIEADFDNIRAAWYEAVAKRNAAAIGSAVEALTWFCDRRSRVSEHERLYSWAQEAFMPEPGEQPPLVWGQLMVRRANMMMQFEPSDRQTALSASFFEKGLDIARLHNNRFEIAVTSFRLGRLLSGLGNPDAILHVEEALSSFQAMDNQFYISECWGGIAFHYRFFNRIDEHFQYYYRAAELKLQVGDWNGAAWMLWNISMALYSQGDYADAEHTLREAQRIFREVGNQLGMGETIQQYAIRSFLKGDLEEALSLAQEALKFVSTLSHISALMAQEMVACVSCIMDADCHQSLGDLKDSRQSWQKYLNFLELIVPCGLGNYEQARQQLLVVLVREKRNLTLSVKTYVLTILPIIFANQNQEQRAVELFGLLFAQPIEWIGWVRRWGLVTRLLVRLQAELGDKIYADAWERGKKLDLQTVIIEIMAEFGIGENSVSPVPSLIDPLTPRELDVLRLVAQGRSNRQIAEALVIANTTVRGYVHIICQKLGAQNRTHAVTLARQRNLI